LSLDRLGFWPQRGILWAGCRKPPSPLRRLSKRCSTGLRAAGFSPDRHGGEPGAARHAGAPGALPDLPRLDTPIRWRVDEFALVESHLHPSAASYRTWREFRLPRRRH
jgi:2'-5' RNA ligase